MQTSKGTVWIGEPTPGDALFLPSLEFIQTPCALGVLARGNQIDRGAPFVQMFVFRDVQVFSAFDESLYWSHAETADRPRHLLNRVETSPLRDAVMKLRGGDDCADHWIVHHFVICGGDFCGEILASPHVENAVFKTEADARAALGQMTTFNAPVVGSSPRRGPVAGRAPPDPPSSGRRPRR